MKTNDFFIHGFITTVQGEILPNCRKSHFVFGNTCLTIDKSEITNHRIIQDLD